MKIKRRLNTIPGPDQSMGKKSCPDIFELDTGDFAIIGKDVTREISKALNGEGKVADNERVVVIPRVILTSAKNNIPVE
jgi:hypothetical protein